MKKIIVIAFLLFLPLSITYAYTVGDIEEKSEEEVALKDAKILITEDTATEEEVEEGRKYNLIIPLLISVFTYWSMYFLIKKNKFFGMNIVKFNAFWNTILLFTLLIPALGFGIFMMLRIQKPKLWNIDFDFMYWHVELSLVMGILGLNHFIQRLGIYFTQLKKRKV